MENHGDGSVFRCLRADALRDVVTHCAPERIWVRSCLYKHISHRKRRVRSGTAPQVGGGIPVIYGTEAQKALDRDTADNEQGFEIGHIKVVFENKKIVIIIDGKRLLNVGLTSFPGIPMLISENLER